MKNKVLFSHSYFLRFDPKQWHSGQPYPPLGTIYAAAYIRQHGYEVSLFDSMFAVDPNELAAVIENEEPDYFVIYDDVFNYLTKMCLTNMRDASFKMINIAKSKKCKVIIAGSDATDRSKMYLEQGADFVIIGEGEHTLLQILDGLKNEIIDFRTIDGLIFFDNNCPVRTKKRDLIKNLDELPFPAWDLIDIRPYRESWKKHAGYFSLNAVTTRGCPFKCNWCAKPIYGNRYNSRSPRNIVDELIILKEKFNFDHIWFCDDIFGLKPGWVKEFADIIEKENLQLRFKIQARVDLLLKENTIKDLARAGCESVWMGAESGSQKILDAMDKGTTVYQIYQATTLLKKNKIRPSFFIQFGYPGETKEDIEKTIGMIHTLLPYEIGISVSYPLPGTVFYENVKSQLKDKTNWKDSDEMALMFRNTYHPAFYKQLHSYVHKSYRLHLAIANWKQLMFHPVRINLSTIKKAFSAFYYAPAALIDKRKLYQLEKV